MAEAAGAYYAVETLVEGAVAAAKGIYDPTLPLRANLVPVKDIPLPRYGHSVSLVKGRAYVFGGVTEDSERGEELASNEVNVMILPQSGMESTDFLQIAASGESPSPRQGHSAAVLEDQIYVYGGSTEIEGDAIAESGAVWMLDTSTSKWTKLVPKNPSQSPPARLQHASVTTQHPQRPAKRTDEGQPPQRDIDPEKILPEPEKAGSYGTLIIHGGIPGTGDDAFNDTWAFDIASRTWSPLPSPSSPTRPATPPALALQGSRLYTYTAGQVQYMDLSVDTFSDKGGNGELDVSALSPWTPIPQPIDTQGPGERSGAGFEVVTTGQGRFYLVLIGGQTPTGQKKGDPLGDIWTLQLRPEGMTAASFKDAARMAIKKDTGERQWAEVRYYDAEGVLIQEGQKGRGLDSRTTFACAKDWDEDGGTVFVHGGKANGQILGDGLLITVDI